MKKFNELDGDEKTGVIVIGLMILSVIVALVSCAVTSYTDSKTISKKVQQRTSVQFEEKTCSEGADMPCHEWATVSTDTKFIGMGREEFEITIWGGSNRKFTCSVGSDGIVKKFDDVVVTISENGCRFERFVAF